MDEPFCALSQGTVGAWNPLFDEVDVRGELVEPDRTLQVIDQSITIIDADGATSVVTDLPNDGAGIPSYDYVGRSTSGVYWASRDGSVSARYVDGAWERSPTVSPVLRSVVATESETWGLGTDRVLASWDETDGWVRVRDDVDRLFPI